MRQRALWVVMISLNPIIGHVSSEWRCEVKYHYHHYKRSKVGHKIYLCDSLHSCLHRGEDDPVWVVDTFAPPGLRQHPLSGDIRIFQKEHFAEDENGSLLCGLYYLPESRVTWTQSVSGCLMMFCSGRWWPRLPQILMFCAEMLSCHLVIRITLISAHK